MKRKLISAVALIMCAIMFLFCGCKSKKNGDDTTAPSESGAAVDVAIDESSEPSSEETTNPEKKEPASDAIKKVTDITKKPGKVNTTTPSVKKPEWKKAGKYTCGKNLAAGEYYVVPESKECSLVITDGKHFGEDDIVEFEVLPFGLFVTMKAGYTLEVKNGKFISAADVDKMSGENGRYEIGTYRVGVDIPAGEHVIGNTTSVDIIVLSTTDYFDEDGEMTPLIGEYPAYVSLKKGERVMFLEDTTVDIKTRAANADGSFDNGMYKVGKDIKPGKYLLVPNKTENAYVVYYDLRYIQLSIADSGENITDTTVIELTNGRYIEINGFTLAPYVEPPTAKPSETTTDAPETTTKTPDTTTTTAQGTPSES